MKNMIRRVECFFGHHELYKTQDLDRGCRRLACANCGRMWFDSDEFGRHAWSQSFHKLYSGYSRVKLKYLPWEKRS